MVTHTAVRTVSKNAFYNLFGAFWQFVLVIVGTQLVIKEIGADSFGLLALVGGISGYFVYMEIGIAETVIKKVSEAKDYSAMSRVASTLFFFSAFMGLIVTILLALFGFYGVPVLFSFEPELMQSAVSVFLFIAAGMWILYPLNLFFKVFVALQRLDIYNILRIIFQTLILAGMIAVLKFYPTAHAAVAVMTAIGIVWKFVAYLYLKKLYPEIRVSPALCDAGILKDGIRYKTFAFAGQASGLTINQCDAVIIGILLNPAAIAVYSVANVLAIKISEVSGVLGAVIFPLLSKLYGSNQSVQIKKIFLLGPQLMALALLPVTAFFVVYADPIIDMWVGPEFRMAAPALQLLSIAWFLNAVGILSSMTSKAVNRPEIDAKLAGGVAFANVILDFILIPKAGMMGAVYATLFCQAVGVGVYIRVIGKSVEAEYKPLFGELIKIGIAGSALASVYYLPLPSMLFWIKPVLHIVLFWYAYYSFIVNDENRIYLRNIANIVIEQLLSKTPLGNGRKGNDGN